MKQENIDMIKEMRCAIMRNLQNNEINDAIIDAAKYVLSFDEFETSCDKPTMDNYSALIDELISSVRKLNLKPELY